MQTDIQSRTGSIHSVSPNKISSSGPTSLLKRCGYFTYLPTALRLSSEQYPVKPPILMKRTGLTLGGFIQPSSARNILEHPSNMEKGLKGFFSLSQNQFLFDELEKVNRDFSASIGDVEVTEVWAQDYKL